MSRPKHHGINVRALRATDLPAVAALSREIYPRLPWTMDELTNLSSQFMEGQLVAVEAQPTDTQGEPEDETNIAPDVVVGFAGSLILSWDDYDLTSSWHDLTEGGTFNNHDPENGRTLYGVEVMVSPRMQGRGVGKLLYAARRDLCRRLNLLRIRGGARLANYHEYEQQMSVEDYIIAVVNDEIGDPTLSFQLKQGFRVLGVVRDYMPRDSESGGHAAVIEWINHKVAKRSDYRHRDPRFGKRRRPKDIL